MVTMAVYSKTVSTTCNIKLFLDIATFSWELSKWINSKHVGFYVYLYTKQHGSKKGEKYILIRLDVVCVCVWCNVWFDWTKKLISQKLGFARENRHVLSLLYPVSEEKKREKHILCFFLLYNFI